MISMLFSSTVVGQTSPKKERISALSCRIEGTVYDRYDRYVPDATVSIQRGKKVYSVTANSRGRYSMRLPPASYRMVVTSPGFCRMPRALFRLPAKTQLEFDFKLVECPSHYINVPVHEETWEVEKHPRTHSELLVLYGERTISGPFVEYTSTSIPVNVAVSFNLITIWAYKISFNSKDRHLVATGNIDFQAPGIRMKLEKLEIRFGDDGSTFVFGTTISKEIETR
ncbi:MAG: carboxypeptidase-like regulatory domain-containing protein [Pyrinomonadaceae bacterium]